nr:hypothetical protein [Tanacetum cinerariifolium]
EDITLVSVQDDADKEMFNVDTLVEVIDAAQVSTDVTTVTITTKEITLAQALEALKTSKPNVKRIVFHEPGKSTTTTICSQQSHDNGNGIIIEEPVKPKKKDQIRAFKRVNTFKDFRTELVKGKEKRTGEELIQESTKKQKVEDDKETIELKQLMEIIPDEVEVAIDAIPLAVKSSRIVDRKIHKEGKKSYYQIIYKLVEKKYPLTPPTLLMMLEKKLQIDYESKMAYQKLDDFKEEYQVQGRIVRIKSLFDVVGITAAQFYVNTTLMKSGFGLIQRIQSVGYGVLGFLRVGTTFDIFQSILFPYSLNTAHCLLLDTTYWILFPWSLVSAGTDTSYLP